MRHVLTGAAILLVVGIVAGCGGDAPKDASADEFCETYAKRFALEDPSADDIQEYADDLEETGTPDDVSDEEREGFEVQLDYLKSIENEDDLKKLEENDSDMSEDDENKAEAFDEYASTKCKDEISEAIGVPPTDDLTTDPGEIETEPGEVETDQVPSDPDEVTEGAPADASKEEFCEQINGGGELESAAQVRAWGEEMEEIGTPEDISDDARDGFEVVLTAARDAEDDANGKVKEPDISKEDEKKVDAFGQYVGEECKPEVPEAPEVS